MSVPPSTRGRGFALAAARALGAAAPSFCAARGRALGGETLARAAGALLDAAAQARAAAALGRATPAGLEQIDRSWYVPPPRSTSPAAVAQLTRAAYAHLVPMDDDDDEAGAALPSSGVSGSDSAATLDAATLKPAARASAAATTRSAARHDAAATLDAAPRCAAGDDDATRSAADDAARRSAAGHDAATRSAAGHDSAATLDAALRSAAADDSAATLDAALRSAAGHDSAATLDAAPRSGDEGQAALVADGSAAAGGARAPWRYPAAELERALIQLGRRRVALAFVGAPRAGLAQLCARLGEPAAGDLMAEVRALRSAAHDEVKAAQRALFGDDDELGPDGDRAQALFFRVGAGWLAPALARAGDLLRRTAQRLPRPLGQLLLDAATAPSSDAERAAALAQLANVLPRDL